MIVTEYTIGDLGVTNRACSFWMSFLFHLLVSGGTHRGYLSFFETLCTPAWKQLLQQCGSPLNLNGEVISPKSQKLAEDSRIVPISTESGLCQYQFHSNKWTKNYWTYNIHTLCCALPVTTFQLRSWKFCSYRSRPWITISRVIPPEASTKVTPSSVDTSILL